MVQISYRAYNSYHCPNITKQNNNKIHNAITEVSKGDYITMGGFNHGNIKWDTQQSTEVEGQKLLGLIQDTFLTEHIRTNQSSEGIRYSADLTAIIH